MMNHKSPDKVVNVCVSFACVVRVRMRVRVRVRVDVHQILRP